jgi:carbon starvation protein
MHRARYMWVTCMPLVWLVIVTFTASYQKIFSPLPSIGFLAQASQREAALQAGKVAASRIAENETLIFNARLDAVICGLFVIMVATILIDSVRVWIGILKGTRSARVVEAPFVLSRLSPEEV